MDDEEVYKPTPIGTKIRRLRIHRGQTIEEAAASIGASPTSVSGWETGKVTPQGRSIRKIAKWLCVPVSDLVS